VNRKLKILAITFMTVMLSSTTALAFPTDCIIFGDKAFDMNIVNEDKYASEITEAILNADSIFYSISGFGNEAIFNASNDQEITLAEKASLKDINFRTANGTLVKYSDLDDETPETVQGDDFQVINVN